MKNVLVAQSGGPSPVINSSLYGVIEGCFDILPTFSKIYGARFGILGVLREELIDITAQSKEEIGFLKNTPGAGVIGTCRYKLREQQEEDFRRIIDVFKAHNIGYFFYIGGNDSMDTAHKVSMLARSEGLETICVGIPKTIDNDLGDQNFKLLDHTPGYGSVARFWAYCIQNANEENAGSCTSDPVMVIQVMGRKAGFIPAAARLADPAREMPLQIYMVEAGFTLQMLADNVNDQLKRDGRCIVVVSEGFDAGDIGPRYDAFGHIEYGASRYSVQQLVTAYLNDVGLAARGFARGQVVDTEQRVTSIYASTVDIEEAYQVGKHAVEVAVKKGTGFMATIQRISNSPYTVKYDSVPLEIMAGSERQFPLEWLSVNRLDVTDKFIEYARPLIGDTWPAVPLVNGIQRFTRFKPFYAEKKLPLYLPAGFRK